jgi:predicted regulator of Ras-like GTPase activity (Roadblock/LC7/MglB family)
MENISILQDLLNKIEDINGVKDVAIVTRNGSKVVSTKNSKLERFAWMSAVLMGSAEATSIELSKNLKAVTVKTNETNVIMKGLNDNLFLIANVMPSTDETILENLEDTIKSTEV